MFPYNLIATILGAGFLYGLLFYLLRSWFRKFERDFALVALYVSAYPVLIILVLVGFKQAIAILHGDTSAAWVDQLITAGIITTVSYWVIQISTHVIIYSLKEFAEQSEMMWDNVLIPLLEGVIPVIIVLIGAALILQFSLKVDLTGIWVALGGAGFIIGFATKDILANFFSGIVLLIDTPFQFGDVIRLESGEHGILKKIGLRVTQIYLFENHTEAYIPNSVLQGQTIVNLSRPVSPVYYSKALHLKPDGDLDAACNTMRDIIFAHPDTLGTIDLKLECLEQYFNGATNSHRFQEEKKKNGRDRLLAEQEVNSKLEEIGQALQALTVTLQFIEQGGLNQEDIETVQNEYQYILDLIGIKAIVKSNKTLKTVFQPKLKRWTFQIQETNISDSLITLVREWYRIWLRDPTLTDEDQQLLPEIWEYKIELLKRRVGRLLKKILNPTQVETRLDDSIKELLKWLKIRFKQTSYVQEPQVRLEKTVYGSSAIFVQVLLEYFVDDIRLEYCGRGERVNSEIYREILMHLKPYVVGRWT
jgi:MscS family membrane protein